MQKPETSNVLLGQLAYDAVREALEKGELKSGDVISEYTVAKWLKISRTPAREGLRRLESEGLLARHSRGGLVVASLDDAALQELYFTRQLLEREAAGLAAKHATDSEIDTLRHLVDAEDAIVHDPRRMYEHNLVFHQMLYRSAHNRYVLKFLNAIADAISAHRAISTMTVLERRQAVAKEHRAIVTALAKRDEEAAKKAAANHIQSALKTRMKLRNEAMIEEMRQRSLQHSKSVPGLKVK